MSKLKTLKDIGAYNYSGEPMIIREEIKQMAINWVRQLEIEQGNYGDWLSRDNYKKFRGIIDTAAARLIMIRFFNITEEDLV